jgi:gamma-glutamyltranspeptidase
MLHVHVVHVASAGPRKLTLFASCPFPECHRLLLEGVDVAQAVSSPRLHDQLVPVNASFVEEYTWGHTSHEMPQYVVQQLEARDQNVKPTTFSLGVSQAIFVDYGAAGGAAHAGGGAGGSASGRGVLVAASDSRKDGAPAGHEL